MESGEGMAISEFSYPLFQAYDWWSMYKNQGVQLQIGGSDQYGNIIAGMNAVSHMRKIYGMDDGAAEALNTASAGIPLAPKFQGLLGALQEFSLNGNSRDRSFHI